MRTGRSKRYVVKYLAALWIASFALSASGQSTVNQLWTDLQHKRAALAGVHQVFDVAWQYRSDGNVEDMTRPMVVDMSHQLWRETTGNRIRIFDGTDTLVMEEGGDEFTRVKSSPKSPAPVPCPYCLEGAEWAKAKETDRRPCGFSTNDHTCVVIQVPLQRTVEMDPNTHWNIATEGAAAAVMDIETGMLVQSTFQENVQGHNYSYFRKRTYLLKSFSIAAPADENVFKLPANVHEVKQLSEWDAPRIKKQLAGKPAPELHVLAMNGDPINLASLKGRTVLLDFFTSWCLPCQEDGPALQKLHERYASKELTIVGISVDEERKIVEKYLKEHPKSYPIALTSENEMPRPYQIHTYPTYIVIDAGGNITSAAQGEKGFSELKDLLRKAGLDIRQ